MAKLGRAFEKAVHTFVQTLDPSAEVLFDYKVPDRDTGTLRQCDVWINACIGGHWPISILVSCKDDKNSRRKLDIGAITTFSGEVQSTGATMGVIYSNVGFTEPAVQKAKANGIACCRLYRNEPGDIPSLIWADQFVCMWRVHHPMIAVDGRVLRRITWNDVFNTNVKLPDRTTTLLEVLADQFTESERESIETYNRQGWPRDSICPPGWITKVGLSTDWVDGNVELTLEISCSCYRARLEAVLIDGSYSITNDAFRGQQFGPAINMRADNPGPGWEEFYGPPPSPARNVMVTCLLGPDIRTALPLAIGSTDAVIP